jgi:hypothetical protein
MNDTGNGLLEPERLYDRQARQRDYERRPEYPPSNG